MNITHMIFDIDGTLLDTEDAVLLSLRDLVEESQNRIVDIGSLRFALGIPGPDALQRLGFDDPYDYNSRWEEKFQNYYDRIRVFDGIQTTLRELKRQQYQLGIITSKNKKEFQTDFVPFDLADYFDTVICAEDTRKHKPFSEPMEKFLQLSGAKPEEAVYIGDTFYDFECAKGAGVSFALALWGCKNPEGIAADYLLTKPEDIFDCCLPVGNHFTVSPQPSGNCIA